MDRGGQSESRWAGENYEGRNGQSLPSEPFHGIGGVFRPLVTGSWKFISQIVQAERIDDWARTPEEKNPLEILIASFAFTDACMAQKNLVWLGMMRSDLAAKPNELAWKRQRDCRVRVS